MLIINNLEYSDLLTFSVILNAIMFWFLQTQKSRQSHSTKLLQQFIASLIVAGFFEVLSWIISVAGRPALIPYHYTINILFFTCNLLPVAFGLRYLHYIISLSKEKNNRNFAFYMFPVYLNVVLIIVNAFVDGFLFSVDAENVYHRGIATYIGNGVSFLFVIGVVCSFYRNKQMITGRITQVILVLILLPVIGVVLQMAFYGLSLAIPAYTLAIFITFLLMERHELQKDPLTLLHSRPQMENRLQYKLRSPDPFTAIMIDVNNFKGINDQYGHYTGDQVLKDVSRILLSNANYEDYVCRFGGDEFFVILESVKDIGQAYIKRIDQTLLEYSTRTPYTLGLSYGFVHVAKPDTYDVDELIHKTDQLMYKDKLNRRQ